jgi:hypothetical protein
MGIKLGIGIKQLVATAHAVVAAVSPMGLVFATEGALGGSLSCDGKGVGFSDFFAQQGSPLGVGFSDGVRHGWQVSW